MNGQDVTAFGAPPVGISVSHVCRRNAPSGIYRDASPVIAGELRIERRRRTLAAWLVVPVVFVYDWGAALMLRPIIESGSLSSPGGAVLITLLGGAALVLSYVALFAFFGRTVIRADEQGLRVWDCPPPLRRRTVAAAREVIRGFEARSVADRHTARWEVVCRTRDGEVVSVDEWILSSQQASYIAAALNKFFGSHANDG